MIPKKNDIKHSVITDPKKLKELVYNNKTDKNTSQKKKNDMKIFIKKNKK